MDSLTVNIDSDLKKQVQVQTKKDGVSLTFIITQALKAYNNGQLQFGLLSSDNTIMASFDVSTDIGKKECLEDFKKL
jgi:hypothetical protein